MDVERGRGYDYSEFIFVTKYCDTHICIYKEDLGINKQTDSKNLIIIRNKTDVEW